MSDLQTTPQYADHLSPKDALRAHVDHLPLDKQYEFVAMALNLISQRSAPLANRERAGQRLVGPSRKRVTAH